MKIGEVSEVLGISISNIRFYEKKGLVGPARDKESKYRNYMICPWFYLYFLQYV